MGSDDFLILLGLDWSGFWTFFFWLNFKLQVVNPWWFLGVELGKVLSLKELTRFPKPTNAEVRRYVIPQYQK